MENLTELLICCIIQLCVSWLASTALSSQGGHLLSSQRR